MLDHFNPNDKRTFQQRWYKNIGYGKTDVPRIIIYIGGEATLTERYITSGSIVELSRNTNSYLFSLEHRFFGESMPFDELTTENLAYLTSDQALEDLASFITYIKSLYCTNSSCPVMVVGGSYPGTLSSYFRLKYPHMANFSWASSAPVLVKNEFFEYDAHLAHVLNRTDPKCYQNTRTLMKGFEEHPERLKALIGAEKSTNVVSHLSAVSDFIAGMIQYENVFKFLGKFCARQHDHPDEAAFFKTFHEFLNVTQDSADDMDDLLKTNASIYTDYADSRSWSWMTCNEFGWFQTASGLLRPYQVNLTYSELVCQTLFGVGVAETQEKRRVYGSQKPNSNMIVFTNGNVDPWSTISISNIENPSLGRYEFYINGSSHCSDLKEAGSSDTTDLLEKRKRIIQILESWMSEKCQSSCKYGECVMGTCKCRNGYYGDDCSYKHVSNRLFKAFATLVVGMPTLMMIIIGFAAWFLFKKDREDNDIRTIP